MLTPPGKIKTRVDMFCCTGSGRTDTYGCSKAKEHSQDQCQKQHYDSFTFLHSFFSLLDFCPRSCSSACQPFSVMITADGGISQTDYCPLITCQCGFYHDGALHTFSLEFASDFIIAFDISLEMECICRTSATTVETCEAVFAVFSLCKRCIRRIPSGFPALWCLRLHFPWDTVLHQQNWWHG